MGASLVNTNEGILTVKIAGKLTQAEFVEAQNAAAKIFKKGQKVRMLVLARDFEGWGPGDWSDFSFQMENDQFVEKMAIVGLKKWEELTIIFTAKGFRSFPIQYFLADETEKAQAWLEEPNAVASKAGPDPKQS